MMNENRVTIRNIDPDLWDALRDVAFENGMSLGEAVSDAIAVWYHSLEEVDETA